MPNNVECFVSDSDTVGNTNFRFVIRKYDGAYQNTVWWKTIRVTPLVYESRESAFRAMRAWMKTNQSKVYG